MTIYNDQPLRGACAKIIIHLYKLTTQAEAKERARQAKPSEEDQHKLADEPFIKELAYPHLIKMMDDLSDQIETWPIDKINRWIGFIQCALVVKGVITVDSERDHSRPIFTRAWQVMEDLRFAEICKRDDHDVS